MPPCLLAKSIHEVISGKPHACSLGVKVGGAVEAAQNICLVGSGQIRSRTQAGLQITRKQQWGKFSGK